RHNPTNRKKTGRRLVAAVTRARVRHSSNMGPTFNARTPVKRGSSVNATHAFPQSPDNQLTILSTQPGPTTQLKDMFGLRQSTGQPRRGRPWFPVHSFETMYSR